MNIQVLADRIGIPCTLIRGNYNLAWNEVLLAGNVKLFNIILNICVYKIVQIISICINNTNELLLLVNIK